MKISLSRGKRLSDVQLSRILGEHDTGHFTRGRAFNWNRYPGFPNDEVICCINQAAYNESNNIIAHRMFQRRGRWFDYKYDKSWSPDKLLRRLVDLDLC